jgi:DNA-binding sugar fermentation-stimulating protein
MRNTKLAGDLAEIAFLYRALGRALIVSKPYGDNARYDFVVDNGTRSCRVQVKSCATADDATT